MGKTPKVPAPPPPSPTPPSFASAFVGKKAGAVGMGMGGTFLTQGMQALISKKRRKTVLG